MSQYVDISFDCAPLRSVVRMDVPLDAPDDYRELHERVKAAIAKHGVHNTYYLYNGDCRFHLTNRPEHGMLDFAFEGTVITDQDDRTTRHADLAVCLRGETCPWLSEPVVAWFHETVAQAVRVEFDRFIEAGDLQQAVERLERLQAESDERGGFVGMGL
jgi:hypothetical protein